MSDHKIEPTKKDNPADRYGVVVTEKGPYLVYGRPPLNMQSIRLGPRPGGPGFEEGTRFEMRTDPTALCRCGASRRKPYCDGTHATTAWDPTLTAPMQETTAGRTVIEGATLTLEDNPRRCTLARFCQAEGDVRSLVGRSDEPESRRRAIHEAELCPGGRLTARDRQSGEPFEILYEPSLGLIEAPSSGPAADCGCAAALRSDAKTGAPTPHATASCSAAADVRPTNPSATARTPPSNGGTGSKSASRSPQRKGSGRAGLSCRSCRPKDSCRQNGVSQPGRQAERPAQRQRPGYPTKSGCPLGQQPK